MTAKTWFITGASRGLGRHWAEAALERGDRVAAAARSEEALEELAAVHGEAVLPLKLDVADRAAAFDAVGTAHRHFGRLDVVVNNAGYGHDGFIEEISELDARRVMDTNFFGALWVTQAALPFLRDQGCGHIIQVSSVGGLSASAHLGIYCASKFALEGISEALTQEVRDFGVHVTIVEPGGFRTSAYGSTTQSGALAAYDQRREQVKQVQKQAGAYFGDPAATSAAILRLVDSEDPPSRLILGRGLIDRIAATYTARLDTWRDWEPVSIAAHGETGE